MSQAGPRPEAIAFTKFQSVQQDAMRELAASEFASLLELRLLSAYCTDRRKK